MKEKFLKVAQKLGLVSKIKEKKMTSSDWDTLASAFKEEHGVDLATALDEAQAGTQLSEDHQAILAALTGDVDGNGNPVAGGQDPEGGEGANGGDGGEGTQTPSAQNNPPEGGAPSSGSSNQPQTQLSVQEAIQMIADLRNENKSLRNTPEGGDGTRVQAPKPKKIAIMGPGTNETHLFGIKTEMFARNKRWNEVAATRKVKDDNYSPKERQALMDEFDEFGIGLGQRFNDLFVSGQLPAMIAGNLDYTDLESELGAYYQVRRMDAVIDYLFRLDSLANIFPVRYNVQDEEIVTNVFEGKSYSQAYQSGRVFSGGFKFQPAKAKVKDVMFKYKFSDLKQLEREYIGYLNTNGSDPIKWGFIEWIMVKCGTIQMNEVEQRRIAGVRIAPTDGKASHFMYASDGFLTTLDRLKDNNQVYVLSEFKTYVASGLLEYVRSFVRTVWRLKGAVAFRQLKLYMNELDVPDFYEQYRDKYGKDTNFSGEKLEIKDFPLPTIVPVPNMGERKDMWMAPEGAIEIQENKPGEFMAYNFQRDFEELYVMSYKKEGTFMFAGRKFETQADLVASKGKHTNIFANNPVVEVSADATTVDAFEGEMFETAANSGATAITDIANASEGFAYKVICGSTTNATTIAKSGKFANITAAFNPSAVGDYLKVIYDPVDEVFIELERKVGGTVAVNENAKAPEYVEQL